MIKFDTSDSKIEINGTVIDMAAESSFMIRQIYKIIREKNPDAGERFKELICNGIKDCFLSDEELHELTEEMEKRIKSTSKLFDILNDISGLAEGPKTENSSENKDIRQADFDSEKAFNEWFHGQEE